MANGLSRAEAERIVRHALEELTRLYEEAAAAIDATADPQAAFEIATKLQDEFADYRAKIEPEVRKLRARQAVRIREAEKLTLAVLAERISMSPTRAHQLVKHAGMRPGGKGDQ
jgi:DNA-binding transcriptional regulator YiaG